MEKSRAQSCAFVLIIRAALKLPCQETFILTAEMREGKLFCIFIFDLLKLKLLY